MFFIYTLLVLTVLSVIIFAVPLHAKVWATLSLVSIAALACSAMAIGVLTGAHAGVLWSFHSTLFGADSGSMDALSALFVLIISIGSIAAALYSRGYLAEFLTRKSPAHIALHYTALATVVFAMLGIVCSDGGYSFLFFWELMTIATFLLILFDAERREVRRAALSYLIMMHVGFMLLLVGFVQLNAATGSATFAALASHFAAQPTLPLFIIFLVGFGMKAGLFPMHVWLPETYPAAPSHVAALMSGVMIKTGIYGILRITAAISDLPMLHTAGVILLVAGIITGVWCVILAAAQNDIKRLLAYSSAENMGVILIGLGIAALGKASGNHLASLCGISGALLHTTNHSLFKSLLFMGAGNICSKSHTTSLDALGGMAKQMPMTSILFLAGCAGICALPPLNGFVSELLIYLGMIDGIASGSDMLASGAGLAALALIGGVVILAFSKLFGTVFLGAPRTHEVAEASEVDNLSIAAMAIPLAGMLFVGLFPQVAVGIVTRAAGFFISTPADAADYLLSPTLSGISRAVWLLLAVVGLLAWLRHRALRTRPLTHGPTWGCGFTSPNVRMQYTGESFSEGLQSIATSLTEQGPQCTAISKGEIFPASHGFEIDHKDRIGNLFSAWWVEMLRMINQRMMRLRTGKINHYILFALAFLGLVFLLSIFNLLG